MKAVLLSGPRPARLSGGGPCSLTEHVMLQRSVRGRNGALVRGRLVRMTYDGFRDRSRPYKCYRVEWLVDGAWVQPNTPWDYYGNAWEELRRGYAAAVEARAV